MGKVIFLTCFLLLFYVCYVYGLDVGCPLSSSMSSCTPKCKDERQCHGQKCCPNICGSKSCVSASQGSSNKYGDGYKGINTKANTATGSYCGNEKCNSFQKCEVDRSTNRQKCVRG